MPKDSKTTVNAAWWARQCFGSFAVGACGVASLGIALIGCPVIANLDEFETRDGTIPADASADAPAESNLVADSAVAEPGPFECGDKPADGTGPQRVTVQLVSMFGGLRPDVGVRLCGVEDFPCSAPVPLTRHQPTDSGPGFVSPEGGVIEADVSTGFAGYFEIKSRGYVPTFRQFAGRVPGIAWDGGATVPGFMYQYLLDPKALSPMLGKPFDAPWDGSQFGLIVLVARDCQGKPIPEVTFVSDALAGTRVFYDFPEVKFGLTATSARGEGGFFDVPPGSYQISVVDKRGNAIGSMSARVVQGAATFVDILPGTR